MVVKLIMEMFYMNIFNACSIFGHKRILVTAQLEKDLYQLFEWLILEKDINIFYFGGFSDFDDLCYKVVTELKTKYPFIKRVYVFEDYKFINRPQKRPQWFHAEDYEALEYFETVYTGFTKRIYFRNCEIIDRSDVVVFYVNHTENSGAYKAIQYATRKKKLIFNVCK